MYATGEKINITQIEGQFPQAPFPTMEEREAFVKDWIQVPDDKFKQYLLEWEPRGEKSNPYYPTVEASCDIVDWQEKMHYIDDALGICAGLSSFPLKPPYHIHNFPKFISAATGIDFDEAEPVEGGHAQPHPAARHQRAGAACGAPTTSRRRTTGRSASPSWRRSCWTSTTSSRAGTANGIPTKASLHELDLDCVAEDLEQRGILGKATRQLEGIAERKRKGRRPQPCLRS